MSGAAANQHIELDGGILARQVSTLQDAASTFDSVAGSVDGKLSGDAFGALCQGLLVPAVSALASRSRELLDAAHTLSDRMATATNAATTTFDTLENEAVDTFSADAG
ncbi:MAG: hypothetical protein NT132_01930 [Microbacterium sp.]|uniref:hypothetical protein n=1 Tax=Microbacterium sp. TaxID=51671 RepID=UPI002620166A|nr:hypothetical protein [Microbacterium sp.]MCX6501166.1 hypothetical protein [Microbacterium sp.]